MKSVADMLSEFLRTSEVYINDNPPVKRAGHSPLQEPLVRSGDRCVEACWTAPDGYTNIHTDNYDMQAQFEVEGKWPDRIREGWGFA